METQASRRTFALLAWLLAAFLATGSAHAFPAEVQIVAKVSVGKNPKLIVNGLEAATKAEIKLTRSDGKTFHFPLGTISPGTIREINLDGRAGRHTYTGAMTAVVDGSSVDSPLEFETVVAHPISIQANRENLDFEKRRLEIFINRRVSSIELKVIGLNGQAIEESTHKVDVWTQGEPIVLHWKHAQKADLMRLEVRAEDEDGFYSAVELTPWQVEIPHEEVLFGTGSAKIEHVEVTKLEDSLVRVTDALRRYAQIRGVQLFIAGHTDTQGSAAYNLNLSRRRAQAIAAWFVENKVAIPVWYAGFGESALKVKTADEVDEPRNRRVDYILSVDPPAVTRAWTRLN
jgi:outer membrane protein OmpA-like peptidoglycan-associated protein